MNTDNLIKALATVNDEEVNAMVRPQTKTDLAERIMASSADGATEVVRPGRRRRWLFASVPLTGALAAAAVVALSSGGPGEQVGPVQVGPPRAQAAALSFTRQGKYLIVKVKDPVADPARYRKEFAAHGLNIDLKLAPTSPRRAGSVIFLEDDGSIETIIAKGCGPVECGVGVKVPLNYKGYASVVFGRAARPGEKYDTGPGDAPGEGVGLSNVQGRSVADVLAEANRRHIGDIEYRYEHNGSDQPYPNGVPADQVKSDWYVHDVAAGSNGEVILFVGPTLNG